MDYWSSYIGLLEYINQKGGNPSSFDASTGAIKSQAANGDIEKKQKTKIRKNHSVLSHPTFIVNLPDPGSIQIANN